MSRVRVSLVILVIVALGVIVSLNGRVVSQQSGPTPNAILEYNARVALGQQAPAPKRQPVSDGALNAYLEARGSTAAPAAAAAATALSVASSASPSGSGSGTEGCRNVFPGPFPNIRVNHNHMD